ncbi:MAG: lipoprotein signal peptidase [Gammaproteobacteria bacterium]|nr:lipoprotein signal peptidase [Gammaproteobacteria bacterium]
MAAEEVSQRVGRERGGLVWLWLSALVLALDQLSKVMALAWLVPYQPVPLTGFFNLTLSFNPGAAFSFLNDAGGWQRWLFVTLAVAVCAFLGVWLYRDSPPRRLGAAGIALVIGGALGNVYDRVMREGLVVDFLDFHAFGRHYPIFNLADSAICVGVALIVLFATGTGRRD